MGYGGGWGGGLMYIGVYQNIIQQFYNVIYFINCYLIVFCFLNWGYFIYNDYFVLYIFK